MKERIRREVRARKTRLSGWAANAVSRITPSSSIGDDQQRLGTTDADLGRWFDMWNCISNARSRRKAPDRRNDSLHGCFE